MQGLVNIQVRVEAKQAQAALKGVERDLRRLQATGARGMAGAGTGLATVGTEAKQASKSLSGLSGAFSRGLNGISRFGGMLRGASASLIKMGKDLQWTGRQLEFRFTLPIVAAAAAGAKWALAQDKAMTRVKKVYGDGTESVSAYAEELALLERGFFAISNIMGIHVEEVTEIGAVWAQAGAEGATLAKAVKLTTEAMVLGDLAAEDAATGLIAIAAAYRMNINELEVAMHTLNVIENELAIGTGELIRVIQDAGGVAELAGQDIRFLGAMAASLVPAAGSASKAGNGLKSIIARVMAPTKQAAKAFEALGVNLEGSAWQGSNFTQKMELLVDGFKDLDAAQQLNFARQVGQVRQISRLAILLEDMADANGRYAKAIRATGNEYQNMVVWNRELETLLASDSRGFQVLTNQLRNMLTQVMIPLIPVINGVLNEILKLVHAFRDLSPETQKMIGLGIAFIAIVGPIMAASGAILMLIGSVMNIILMIPIAVGKIMMFMTIKAVIPVLILVAKGIWAVALALGGWPVVIGLAIAALAALFAKLGLWDDIGRAIANMWNKLMTMLPESVAKGLGAVIRTFDRGLRAVANVVKSWVMAIWNLLSYLNPFAKHSPSLVDEVQRGVRVIVAEYRGLSRIKSTLDSLIGDFRRFAAAAVDSLAAVAAAARELELVEIGEVLGPEVAAAARGLDATLVGLNQQLEQTALAYIEQERVVKQWEAALRSADLALEAANDDLAVMQDRLSALQGELSEAEARLQGWAGAAIAGTQAWDDAIFANTMSQKQLQLEILRMEQSLEAAGVDIDAVRGYMEDQTQAANDVADATDAVVDANQALTDSFDETGLSADDIRGRMALLRGEIEGLRSKELDLRLAGAGSDVLAGIGAQIDQAEAARRNLASGLARAVVSEAEVAVGGGVGGGPVGGGGGVGGIPSGDIINQVQQLDDLQSALDALQTEGQILSLERDLDLDPKRRQIEQALAGPEFSVGEILGGIATEEANIARIGSEIESINADIAAQEGLIAGLEDERAGVLASYEAEVAKLDEIDALYGEIEQDIRDVETAINDINAATATQKAALEAAAAGGGGGAGAGDILGEGDFPGAGGSGFDLQDGGDLADLIAEWEELAKTAFDGIDPFKPLKDAWETTVAWFEDTFGPFFDGFNALAMDIGSVDWMAAVQPFIDAWDTAWGWVTDLWDLITGDFDLFGVGLESRLGSIVEQLDQLWRNGWEAIQIAAGLFWEWLTTIIQTKLDIITTAIQTFFGWFTVFWEQNWGWIEEFVGLIWLGIQLFIEGQLQFINGILQTFIGIFTLNWRTFWDGIVDIATGLLKILEGVFALAFGAIGVALGIAWTGLQTLTKLGMEGLVGVVEDVGGTIQRAFSGIWDGVGSGITGAFGWIKGKLLVGVNAAIGVLNLMISGVEWAIRKIPGVSSGLTLQRIGYVGSGSGGTPSVPTGIGPGQREHARGVRGIGGGFMTDGAQAIVGEGRRAYPEYVVPTDPQYRDRALMLTLSLMKDMNLMASGGVVSGDSIPRLGAGDILGGIGSAIAGAAGGISSRLGKFSPFGAVRNLWNAYHSLSGKLRDAKNSMPGGLPGRLGSSLLTGLVEVAKKRVKAVIDEIKSIVPGFSEGGVAKARPGGVAAVLAEAGQDEAVVPLPAGTRARMAAAATEPITKNLTFTGDLSFPNITDANDAEIFIRNLEALADA